MLRAAWERFAAWWSTKAWPSTRSKTVEVFDDWWLSIGDSPRAHFVSMVFGMVILFVVKAAVWLAT